MALRDLGRGIQDLTRPDGGPILPVDVSSAVNRGAAAVTSILTPPRASDPIVNGTSNTSADPNKVTKVSTSLPSLVKNPLEDFASMTPVWTMACLTPLQFNDPRSYRSSPSDLKHVIFSSAGRFDKQRQTTAYGSPEYYVNNFVMNSVIAPNERTGNTNAIKFDFDVYEPYSMGILLQSMQNAAIQAGYANYLESTPYVLRLDFKGFKETGEFLTSVKPKFFTIKLIKVTFQVTESGSMYHVEAIPYNHSGYSDVYTTLYTDIKLTSGNTNTVEDLLVSSPNSLCNVLNNNEKELQKAGHIGIPDEYYIQFPKEFNEFVSIGAPKETKAATVDPAAPAPVSIQGAIIPNILKSSKVQTTTPDTKNEIGLASLNLKPSQGGNFLFKKYDEQVDPATGVIKRGNLTIDPTKRTFQFSQGQDIVNIITQIVNSSDYAKRAMDPVNLVNGMVKWYRIDVQVELITPDPDPIIGDFARRTTFRVVPYMVHQSIFTNPSTTPLGYEDIQKQVAKGYNYIYTGQNVDILKFEINIDTLFYTGGNPSPEVQSGKISDQNQAGPAENLNKTTTTGGGTAPAAQFTNTGRARKRKDPKLLNKPKGALGTADTEQLVAESFHQAFISGASADMINIDLEILGDPYWMVDSGISNYFAEPDPTNTQKTADGTMNYEAGDVYVYLTFKNPIDINETTGLYDIPKGGKLSPFSGIYRVIMCESSFADAVFKQKLKLIRMPGQSIDYVDNPAEAKVLPKTKDGALSTFIANQEAAKSSITDKSYPKF